MGVLTLAGKADREQQKNAKFKPSVQLFLPFIPVLKAERVVEGIREGMSGLEGVLVPLQNSSSGNRHTVEEGLYRRQGKGRRCCLRNRMYSMHCHASCLAPG